MAAPGRRTRAHPTRPTRSSPRSTATHEGSCTSHPGPQHEEISLDYVKRVFDVMGRAHWHTFPKRHDRVTDVAGDRSSETSLFLSRVVSGDRTPPSRHKTFKSSEPRLGPASSSFGMRPATGPFGRRVTDPGDATIDANLLSGAVRVRNPLGHRSVQCDDAIKAVEMLLIADLRMRQLGSISSRSVRLNLRRR